VTTARVSIVAELMDALASNFSAGGPAPFLSLGSRDTGTPVTELLLLAGTSECSETCQEDEYSRFGKFCLKQDTLDQSSTHVPAREISSNECAFGS
jgi:hypothetical protein